MEFSQLQKFFDSLTYMKRKYPMIVTYNKYLKDLSDDLQIKEVEFFQAFLIQNQSLHDCVFTCPLFKTGKKSGLVLDMTTFIQGSDTQIEKFWTDVWDLEKIMFPKGKPDTVVDEPSQNKLQGAFATLESNPLFAGVIDQIKSSINNMGDASDIESIMTSPDFKHIVDNIKGGLSNGKYKLKDLTSIVEEIVKAVQQDLDPETQETLQTVSNGIQAVERGEALDMNKIMNAVTKLKLK
jgi:hypothetical protein